MAIAKNKSSGMSIKPRLLNFLNFSEFKKGFKNNKRGKTRYFDCYIGIILNLIDISMVIRV